MRNFLLATCMVLVAIATTINADCRGQSGESFCPKPQTKQIEINKNTCKSNPAILDVTIKCLDANEREIDSCTEEKPNPYPGVQINSFKFIGTYGSEGSQHRAINRRFGVNTGSTNEQKSSDDGEVTDLLYG